MRVRTPPMQAIRRYIGGLNLSWPFNLKIDLSRSLQHWRFYSILTNSEALAVSLMAFVGLSAFQLSQSSFMEMPARASVAQKNTAAVSSVEKSSKRSAAKVAQPFDQAIQMVAHPKDRYSFQEALLGFHLNDISFLEGEDMTIVERQLELSLPKKMRARARKYIRPTLLLSEHHQVDPFWVLSVMWTESHFNPTAKSSVGANGLMQLMPKTKAWLYNKYRRSGKKLVVENELINLNFFYNNQIPAGDLQFHKLKLVNIELGVIYLKYLLEKFDFDHRLATVAYNMGPGWTRMRLRKRLPVGEKNLYLTKVEKAYQYLSQKI